MSGGRRPLGPAIVGDRGSGIGRPGIVERVGSWIAFQSFFYHAHTGAALVVILGRRFHMAGSPEVDIFFRLRERLVMVAELGGGICILGRRFSRAEGAWMEQQGSVDGIFRHFCHECTVPVSWAALTCSYCVILGRHICTYIDCICDWENTPLMI